MEPRTGLGMTHLGHRTPLSRSATDFDVARPSRSGSEGYERTRSDLRARDEMRNNR